MSRTQDREGGASVHDGEHAEHRENKHHSTDSTDQGSEPDTQLRQRAVDGEVCD